MEEKQMKQEKSCGAVVYRRDGDRTHILLLKHKYGGNWAFPKGHVEPGEREYQTALREVKEETGLTVNLVGGFRETVEYRPKPNIQKQVVYFLGEATTDRVVKQEEEISEIRWLPIEDAAKWISFENHRQLLAKARGVIESQDDGERSPDSVSRTRT